MHGCLWQIMSLWIAYSIVEPHSFLGFLGVLLLSIPVGIVMDWLGVLVTAFVLALVSRL